MDMAWIAMRAAILVPLLAYLCWSDAKRRLLPWQATIGGLVAGLAIQAGFRGLEGLGDGFAAAGICVLIFFVPCLLGGAGGGDLKLFAACGAFLGVREIPFYMIAVSFAGIIEMFAMLAMRRGTARRLAHYLRCMFDWRYDRAAGRAALPPRDSEKERIPYGIAIAAGCLATIAAECVFTWA